jgi:diacylglycerol kinase
MQDKGNKFSLKQRLKSFVYAYNGLKHFWKKEHNFQIHLLAALLSIGLGYYLKIAITEWVILVLLIGMVMAAEIFNSAIEHLSDLVMPEQNPQIGKVKDIAAAAVLILAIAALIIGLIIFLPKILLLL